MTDIVDWLTEFADGPNTTLLEANKLAEATVLIERLRSENERLKDKLNSVTYLDADGGVYAMSSIGSTKFCLYAASMEEAVEAAARAKRFADIARENRCARKALEAE